MTSPVENPLYSYFVLILLNMKKELFTNILQSYLNGTCTPAEQEMVERWYGMLDDFEADELKDGADLEEAMWMHIQSRMYKENAVVVPETVFVRRKSVWRYVSVAAAVLVAIGLGWVYSNGRLPGMASDEPTIALKGMLNVRGDSEQGREVTLTDGSVVTLAKGSDLYYPSEFSAAERIVYLHGNARFEIAHDKNKPFKVYSGEIVTKVLGTSFSIEPDEGDIRVKVHSGKVLVERAESLELGSGKKVRGVLLTGNQQAVYYADKYVFVKEIVERPELLPQPEKKAVAAYDFNFKEAALSEVVTKLEAAYGVRILLLNPNIKSCPVTADLSQQEFFTQLQIVCAALKADYEINGANILIKNGNCD